MRLSHTNSVLPGLWVAVLFCQLPNLRAPPTHRHPPSADTVPPSLCPCPCTWVFFTKTKPNQTNLSLSLSLSLPNRNKVVQSQHDDSTHHPFPFCSVSVCVCVCALCVCVVSFFELKAKIKNRFFLILEGRPKKYSLFFVLTTSFFPCSLFSIHHPSFIAFLLFVQSLSFSSSPCSTLLFPLQASAILPLLLLHSPSLLTPYHPSLVLHPMVDSPMATQTLFDLSSP